MKLINSIGAEKTLHIGLSLRNIPYSRTIPSVSVQNRSVITGQPSIQARRISINGSIYYSDRDDIITEFDSIMPFLSYEPICVYQQNTDERHLKAYVEGVPQVWIDGRRELQLRITMIALDPLFYGNEGEDEQENAGNNHRFNLNTGGTAPNYPVFEITVNSPTSYVTITQENTEKSILIDTDVDIYDYNDSDFAFQEGDIITIDTYNYTVKLNGVNRLDLADDEWLVYGFELYDENPLRINTDGNIDIKTTYRPRWY